MRLVLESHSQIHCFDEAPGGAYTILGSPPLFRGALRDCPPRHLVGFKIPRWTEQLCDPILTEKGLEVVADNFYQGEPLVFIVRDVRDTVCSMMNLDMGGFGNWLAFWARTVLQRKIRDSREFRQEFAKEIDMVNAVPEPHWSRRVAIGALYWKYKAASYFRYLDRGFPVLLVHYERLVRRAQEELRRVTDFLGVGWEDALLRHFEFEHYEIVGGTDPSQPIHADSVGQYKRLLRPSEIKTIWRIAGDVMKRFGYTREGT